MSSAYAILLAMLSACVPGRGSEPPPRVEEKPAPAPTKALAEGVEPGATATPLQCVPGTEARLVLARTEVPLGPDFLRDAFAAEAIEGASEGSQPIAWVNPPRLREALFGPDAVPSTPGTPGGVCLATALRIDAPLMAESGRIHRVAGLRPLGTANDEDALAVVLYAEQPPSGLVLEEHHARWQLALVDREHQVLGTAAFVTSIPYDRTWNVLQTSIEAVPHALAIEIRYGLDCDGHVHDQHFSITIDYDPSMPCLRLRSIEHEGFA